MTFGPQEGNKIEELSKTVEDECEGGNGNWFKAAFETSFVKTLNPLKGVAATSCKNVGTICAKNGFTYLNGSQIENLSQNKN